MRVEGPNKPKHDREQCLALADIKWNKAIRTLGDLRLLVNNEKNYPIPGAPMEVLLEIGPRLQRQLPTSTRNFQLTNIRVNLGVLLVNKEDDLVALERGDALIGESFPVMLRDVGDAAKTLLSTTLSWQAISGRAMALSKLGRGGEAVAWMREYVPRFEAVGYIGETAALYRYWVKVYLHGRGDEPGDEAPWMDWDEAERVARKAVAAAKAGGESLTWFICMY
jgi:hypothetical protein